MTQRAQQLSTNAWHKISSDFFNERDTSLGGKLRSGTSHLKDEALPGMAGQQPSTNNRKLSAEFCPSERIINRHLHNFSFVNNTLISSRKRINQLKQSRVKTYREVSHEMTNGQAQRRMNISEQLLANPQGTRFHVEL